MQVYLVVVSGPEASRSYPLPSGRTHIGIDPSNEIVLDDRYVSRHHCVIDLNDDGALVTDLGSKNGTCINGRPIQQAPLRPGDRLTVGLTDLVLSKKPAPSGSLSAESSGTETVEVEVLRKGDWLATLPAGAVAGMVSKGFAGARRGWEVLRAGYQLARQLHTAEDVEGLSRRVLQHLLAVTEAEWGAVFLRREDGELELCCDLSAEGEQAEPVVYSRSVLAEALSNCSPVLSGELGRDGRFAASESVREGALQSVLCVPLLTESEGAERLERSETTSEGAERPERSETSGEPLGAVYLVSRTKPFAFAEEELAWLEAVAGQLSVALETLFARRQLEEENARLRRQSVLQHGLIGETEAIQEVLQFIRQVAPAEATVLIQGETGTGKELVSRAIHYNSRRQDGPFVCINSAALPRDLIESELFGHEKGAFTGAIRAKPGKFELASGGTVFLDEVGELAPSTQAKLLRVLEGQPFERVGGTKPIRVDVRVLAATNRDLAQAVQEGTFRADLYHRLNVIAVELPPLRERASDIELLAHFFLGRLRETVARAPRDFSPEAMAVMKRYHWPGNARELRNAIEHAIVLGSTETVLPEDLPASVALRHPAPGTGPGAPTQATALRDAEREHILSVYEQSGGNKKKTAQLLGISRDTLYRKLREFGVL